MSVDSVSSVPILDINGALSRFGGDQNLFFDISGMVLEDAPPLISKIKCAIASGDAAAVRMNSHALKGLVAGCGGVRAALAAQALEDAGHAGNLHEADTLIENLEREITLLTDALNDYRL